MNQRYLPALWLALAGAACVFPAGTLAQARPQPKPAAPPATPAPAAPVSTAKPPSKDEVYFAIARRINAQNNTAVSGVVGALGGVIEVKDIAMGADGKATVTVQERAGSNAAYTQKSMRIMLTPPVAGDKDNKWAWEQFEEGRRFYAVDRIFPFTSGDLNRKKQNISAKWANFSAAIGKQLETGIKALETAKAVIKTDPAPLIALLPLRTSLAEALKNNEQDALVSISLELSSSTDNITALADTFEALKANDAYLRLLEEFKAAVNAIIAMRRDYVEAVKVYNESLERLPYALVAYGLEFQRIEPKLTAD
ncbi:MAG: LemA family protein [Acidobacteria bacterium]|nr:LemA family protein [Acidobacteriota bacterium]MBI3422168.1 LemA family protein [Acidobacteriota bacterium]